MIAAGSSEFCLRYLAWGSRGKVTFLRTSSDTLTGFASAMEGCPNFVIFRMRFLNLHSKWSETIDIGFIVYKLAEKTHDGN